MTAYKRAKQLQRTLASIRAQKYQDYEVIVVEDGDDGGDTRKVCEYFHAQYYQRVHRPGIFYSNPAVPNNIGIQKATGDVVILQNAECMHVSAEVIKSLLDRIQYPDTAVFASVLALNENGSPAMYYTHSKLNPRPFFFCGAVERKVFTDLRGFDEDFIGYGYDDDDMALRMREYGCTFEFADDIQVHHLWHPSSYNGADPNTIRNQILYKKKVSQLANGEIGLERNLNREWGQLE